MISLFQTFVCYRISPSHQKSQVLTSAIHSNFTDFTFLIRHLWHLRNFWKKVENVHSLNIQKKAHFQSAIEKCQKQNFRNITQPQKLLQIVHNQSYLSFTFQSNESIICLVAIKHLYYKTYSLQHLNNFDKRWRFLN